MSELFRQIIGGKDPENEERVISSGVRCCNVAIKVIDTDLGMTFRPNSPSATIRVSEKR